MQNSFRLSRQANFLATLGTAIFLVASGTSLGQDTVYLVPGTNAGGPEILAGKVIDFTGRGLSLRLSNGRTQSLPAEQVERVETAQCAEHAAADELFADGDFRQAADRYRAAVQGDREVRGWVRRQILAQTVWCQRASGVWDEAGETFLALAERDPETPYFDCIPLAWTAARPAPRSRAVRGDGPTRRSRQPCYWAQAICSRPVNARPRLPGSKVSKQATIRGSPGWPRRRRSARPALRRASNAPAGENALKPVRRHCVPVPTSCSACHTSSINRTRRRSPC